jgi:hypothetical protein
VCGEDAAQLVMVAHGQVSTAGSPRERHAHRIEPERVDGREDPSRPRAPLDLVVVHADHQARLRAHRSRRDERDGKEQGQRDHRRKDPLTDAIVRTTQRDHPAPNAGTF